MIRLIQHIPGYVDGVKGKRAEAATLEELLAVPWVADYARDTEPIEREGIVTGWVNGVKKTVRVIHDAPEERRFYRWSRADEHLMVEHNHGDYWWVVGTLQADDPRELAALPKWAPSAAGEEGIKRWNRGDTGRQPSYRCAEHGVDRAECCLSPLGMRIRTP